MPSQYQAVANEDNLIGDVRFMCIIWEEWLLPNQKYSVRKYHVGR